MRFLRFQTVATAPLVAAALVACSPDISVELYNNSSDWLLITGCKEPAYVEPRSTVELGSIYSCSAQVKIAGPSSSWRYPVRVPGQPYVHEERLAFFKWRLLVRLQINSDHRILAVPVGSSFPIADDTPQPASYPLSGEAEA